MPARRALLVLSLLLAACSEVPASKPLNLGPPPPRGLGVLAVDTAGHPWVFLLDHGLWKLQGSVLQDTQVWVQQPGIAWDDLLGYAPGVGLVGRKGLALSVAGDGGTVPLPAAPDGVGVRPLLVMPGGAVLGAGNTWQTAADLYRRTSADAGWEVIPDTRSTHLGAMGFASAVLHPDGKAYATNGSRVLALEPDLSAARTLFSCDTRELGSCGGGASGSRVVSGGLRVDGTGLLYLMANNDEPELYTFRPGDAALTRRAFLRSPVNGQDYWPKPQGLVVDRTGVAYTVLRTEQSGGEGHVLAHAPGAAPDAWTTVATGLPRVLSLWMGGDDSVWMWDHSDDATGLWTLVPASLPCPRCGVP